MFDIFPPPGIEPDLKRGWSSRRQYFYSLVWSSFLDLDRYTASRTFLRFRPYSAVWVARELLFDRPDVQCLPIGDGSRNGGSRSLLEGYRLSTLATDLALWTVAPALVNPMKAAGAVGQRGAPESESDSVVEQLRVAFRKDFLQRFGIDLAASSLEIESRSLLPPRPELGIESPVVTVWANRRFATARVEANVQRPFYAMRDVIDPRSWAECGHWEPAQHVEKARGTRRIEMKLRLPGGSWRSTGAKLRTLSMTFEIARGPFDRRIDYQALETARSAPAEPLDRSENEADEAKDIPNSAYDRDAIHVRSLRGFLAVERLAGRPRWSHVIAERTISFDSPNHDRFRVETLLFWLASELLAFVTRRECS